MWFIGHLDVLQLTDDVLDQHVVDALAAGVEDPDDLHTYRTYAVARLCAIPACGKPAKTALGSERNCRMAGRMMSILVVKRDAPVSSSCQIRRR